MRRQVRPGVAFVGPRLNRVHLANSTVTLKDIYVQTLNRAMTYS